jgi:hypothetical protein
MSRTELYPLVVDVITLASKGISNLVNIYFTKLRNDKNHHLGLGDIRLTLGQQEEILSLIESATLKSYKEISKGETNG